MRAIINQTGQIFPIETIVADGVYLRIAGHARFFAAATVTITPAQ